MKTQADRSPSVGEALAQSRTLGLERLDAQLLLGHALQRPRAWLLAHGDSALPPAVADAFAAHCRRRAAGEPLAYLLGEREFHGLMLQVSPAVLVPRPDTETLVDWALSLLATEFAGAKGLQAADLGTGSGAVALALKRRRPDVEVCAVDDSPAAMAVARTNAERHRLTLEFQCGNWWRPLHGRRFHLVLSNPPYVAQDDPHLAALLHEPLHALSPGGDGMGAIEAIVRDAPSHLWPGGWLLLEHGHEQAEAVRRLLSDAGFGAVQTRLDLSGQPRCSGGRRL